MKQRFLAGLLVFVMLFSLVGCTTGGDNGDTTTDPNTEVTSPAATTAETPAETPAEDTEGGEDAEAPAVEEPTYMTRAKADEKYKWDMTEVYPTEAEFAADLEWVNEYISTYGEDLAAMKSIDEIAVVGESMIKAFRMIDKLYLYAKSLEDLNQDNDDAQAKRQQVEDAYYTLNEGITDFTQVLKAQGLESLKAMQATNTYKENEVALKTFFDDAIEKLEDPNRLSDDVEDVLAIFSGLYSNYDNVYTKLTMNEAPELYIENADGSYMLVTDEEYEKIQAGSDTELADKAYYAKLELFGKVNDTLATLYIGEMKQRLAFAKANNYESTLAHVLDEEKVPVVVYDNMVATINNHMSDLHELFNLQSVERTLDAQLAAKGLPALAEGTIEEYSFDDAVTTISDAVVVLGDDYKADFLQGINERWVDAYPDENKYTGAYNRSVQGFKKYVLMNYDDSLNSVFTLAHEMGHALNGKYTGEAQGYYDASNPIFLAEVASTVNEAILGEQLKTNADSDRVRLQIVNNQIGTFANTVFFQAMYAEFEDIAHKKIQAGEEVSSETLNTIWVELMGKYYNVGADRLEPYKYGWSEIPHFYSSFYVYKYVTSFMSASQIAPKIIAGDEEVLANYREFLAVGTSEDPMVALENVGVDLANIDTMEEAMKYYTDLLQEKRELLVKIASEDDDLKTQIEEMLGQ